MKKRLLLTIWILSYLSLAFTQSSSLDSLFLELGQTEEDSSKVDIFHFIGSTYSELKELDSASVYIEKAIQLAEANQLNYRKIKAIYLMGLINENQGKDSLAIEHLLKAKAWYEKSGETYDKFDMHINLGGLFAKMGSVQKAVRHFDFAEIYLSKDNLKEAYRLNRHLGTFLWSQNKYEDARQYYLNNLEVSLQMKDSITLYYAYSDLGLLYNELQKPDSAIYYLEMVLPVFKKHNPGVAAIIQGFLGTNYKSLGNFTQALDYFQKSLTDTKNANESFDCFFFAEMAICYLQLEDFLKAEYYNDLAIHCTDKIQDLGLKMDAFKQLVYFYKMQGDYERALLNLESLMKLEDTLFTIANKTAIEELQVKYQTREQETQMELQSLRLNRQSTVIVLTLALLVLLSTILFLGWRNVRYRKRANKLLSERNQHLEDLDQKKSRFFSNISHELRTPLTLVTAPLEKAFENVKDIETRDNLHLAHRNSQKLLVLVDEILDLSKLESGQMQLNPSPIQLEEVLRRIFFAFQSLANIRRLKLEFNSELPKALWVEADLSKLEKILNNLLSNAIKYSDPGGKVSLLVKSDTSSASTGLVIFQVTDSGKGIDKDDLPKIFDRFYQGNSSRLVGGTGIGLALCKELVHLFDGKISVKSALQKGSTFTVSLPLTIIEKPSGMETEIGLLSGKKETGQLLTTKPATGSYTPLLLDGQKPKILIVEDNPEMNKFLNQTLSLFYECAIAYDGEAALKKLESEHFDLVTSDVMMPQMDGFELLKKVRVKGTVFKNIPFILLTARSLEKDKLDGFQLGVDDYITKPFSVKELMARIQNLLKNKQVREAWEKAESVDKKSLKRAEQIVLDHLSDPAFGVQQLSAKLTTSQRSLERLIKRLTGLSPVGLIREIRLQKAYQMLKRRQFLTVTEVRYAVGIENASYFNRKFKERFGINPKELMRPVLKGEVF